MLINNNIKTLVINNDDGIYLIANINQQNALVGLELYNKNMLNKIYLAKIESKNQIMECFFVSLDKNVQALLPINAVNKHHTVGEKLIVQVVKNASSPNKLAEVTNKVVLQGVFSVFLPQSNELRFSTLLKDEVKNYFKKHYDASKEYGLIVRSNFQIDYYDFFLQEVVLLKQRWSNIIRLSKSVKSFGLLYDFSYKEQIITTDSTLIPKKILCNNIKDYKEIENFIEEDYNFLDIEVELHKEKTTLFTKYNLQHEVDMLLKDTIALNNVELVFIENIAFNFIDINFKPKITRDAAGKEDEFLQANLAILNTLYNQIILRNLGGQILVDFLKIKDKVKREKLSKKVEEVFTRDRNINLYGFSKMGILELTRKKTQDSFSFLLKEPCSSCKGSGFVTSSVYEQFVAFDKLQNLLEKQPEKVVYITACGRILQSFQQLFKKSIEKINQDYNIKFIIDDNTNSIKVSN